DSWNALALDERNVGRPDGVGIPREYEAQLGGHGSNPGGLDVLHQERDESRRQSSVHAAHRAHAKDPAFDELVPEVVLWHPFEVFGRDETLRVGHGMKLLHGSLASSLRAACHADSSMNSL